jgi:hypothetical protein
MIEWLAWGLIVLILVGYAAFIFELNNASSDLWGDDQ